MYNQQFLPQYNPMTGSYTDPNSLQMAMNWGPAGSEAGAFTDVGNSMFAGMGSVEPTPTGVTGNGWNWLGEGGMAPTAIQGFGALMNGWLGMKKLDVAKDSLRENKRQFNMNWGAQKNLTNSRLRDRQQARNASSGSGAYQSVGDYMNQNGIK